jgi:hypothetical protein
MTRRAYDVYDDLHVTHVEIGYLLAIGALLLLFDAACGIALGCWPAEDVYLVSGIADCHRVPVHWGARTPAIAAPAPVSQAAAATSSRPGQARAP